VATTAQYFGGCGQEIEAVVGEILVDQREQDLEMGGMEKWGWVNGRESLLGPHRPSSS
jgi:hypothetical protein